MTELNGAGRNWTFLSNHGHVLICISRNPDLRVRDIADLVGITERSALAILADLEDAGYISIDRIGRRNTYKINDDLRFPTHLKQASTSASFCEFFQSKVWSPCHSAGSGLCHASIVFRPRECLRLYVDCMNAAA